MVKTIMTGSSGRTDARRDSQIQAKMQTTATFQALIGSLMKSVNGYRADRHSHQLTMPLLSVEIMPKPSLIPAKSFWPYLNPIISLSLSLIPAISPCSQSQGRKHFPVSRIVVRKHSPPATFPTNFSGELSGDGFFFYTARSAWRRSPICPRAPEPETHPRAAHARFSGRRLHLTRRRVRAREPLSGDALPPPGSPDADQPPFLPVCAIRALHVPLLGFFCFRGPSDQIFRRPSANFSQLQSLHVP
ncbi:hypothetical protein CK203_046578 [Vitis vinifera]|uniref:Uncharacterized protein n=1 Tax=Vitis vinifera TaxID=29760 RepID=A0A438HL54_VITVI|nr:hypothetical protein CK203_046578 [Vitis vinifera]